MQKVVIIGGGIAGLMAAVQLADRGLAPVLLEADPEQIGGRLKNTQTIELEHQGRLWKFTGEHGVHGIWGPYLNFRNVLSRYDILPPLRYALEEDWILGRGRKVRKASMGSAIRHSEVPAPFHYLYLFLRPRFLNILTLRDVASLFRVLGSLFSAMSIDPVAEQKALRGMSLADFMHGWSPTLRSFFAGLARNALAAHPEDVPASGFIAFLRFYTLLRRDAWQFAYLPGPGGSAVSQPLAEAICNLGGEIRLGAKAVSLNRVKGTAETEAWQIAVETPRGTEHILAENIILALSAPATKTLLESSAVTALRAAQLWYPQGVPTAIFRLWFTSQPRKIAESGIFSGDFTVDNFFWLERLQPEFADWARETGGSAVEMHIYGPPELLAQPDAILLAQAITDIYRAFPELRGTLLHSIIQRNEASHTLFSVGRPGEHLGIQTPWPKLYACGDWVYHPAPALYLERAATTAIAAANAVLQDQGLEPFVLLPHPPPEWRVCPRGGVFRWVRRRLLRLSKRKTEINS